MRSTGLAIGLVLFLILLGLLRAENPKPKTLDPAAWGSDHAGQPVPEYTTGDECLFCHRNDVGNTWSRNRHQLTIHQVEAKSAPVTALKIQPGLKELAEEVKLVMGDRRRVKFLKRASDFGKLAILSAEWVPNKSGVGRVVAAHESKWDSQKFARACAGCHTTGVDPTSHAFSSLSLDCYACHGEVDLNHTKDTSKILLAKKRHDSARVVTSICAQCHLRGGKSKSGGLPYPNNFVAGDNLFRDFKADFSATNLNALNPADRHVWENVRDVVVLGKDETTCLSCHEVHASSSKKHHQLADSDSCVLCHNATGSKKVRPTYEVHSSSCEY